MPDIASPAATIAPASSMSRLYERLVWSRVMASPDSVQGFNGLGNTRFPRSRQTLIGKPPGFSPRMRVISKTQDLAQMLDADTQLLQPRQIVEHAPLLDNAVFGDPENRNLLYFNAPPRRRNAPERTLGCSGGNVVPCHTLRRAQNS